MTSKFEVWDANDPDEYEQWLRAWEDSPEREVSSHPAYGNLFKGSGDRVLCASYLAADHGSILYSFILREIPEWLLTDEMIRPIHDIITPYGYGGPLVWGMSDMENSATEFWKLFDQWASAHNVVTEFIRFGLFPNTLLPYPGVKSVRSLNIVRSLNLDDEAMFMSFEKKVRKNVRKAERSGLAVEIDEHGGRISDFLRIYSGTMERRAAGEEYYFPDEFFEAIHANLAGHFAYAHVLSDNKVISTELILVSERTVYSFLGGTNSEAFELRPNDLLKYEVIRWARTKGKSRYVLGGGAVPGDGIERYKRSFAPDGAVDFLTGQRILQPSVYQQLETTHQSNTAVRNPSATDVVDYFPAYRRPL